MTLQRLSSPAVFLVALVASCPAQTITSAHSGTLHTFDGAVYIDGAAVEQKPATFSQVKESSVLSTQRGRAEVLLTPGVILRVGESSSIKMLDNRLSSTRVEFQSGSAVLEQIDPMVNANAKGNSVVLIYKDFEITLRKNGLIELYSDPPSVKVYKGEAEISAGNSRSVVKDGHMVTLNAVLATEKFNDKTGDELLLWARDRSQAISTANMASARSQNSGLGSGFGSGYGYGGYGYGGSGYGGNGYGGYSNGWFYNPAYGMFTYLPGNGTYWSPWGFGYYSPYSIYNYYVPNAYTWSGGGRATGLAGVNLPHVSGGSTITNTLSRVARSSPGGVIHSTSPSPVAALNGGMQSSGSSSMANLSSMNAGPTRNVGGSVGVSSSGPAMGGSSMGAGAAASHSAGGRGR